MSETLGYPELVSIGCGELHTDPVTKSLRVSAEVDSDREHATRPHSHQLPLRIGELVVKTAQDSSPRSRMIVLDKRVAAPGHPMKVVVTPRFEKEPSIILEHPGFYQEHFRYG